MTQGIFTNSFKSKFLQDFIDDVANTATSYYVTFGKYNEWPEVYDADYNIVSDDNNPPNANLSLKTAFYDVYRNILYGKQITESNISYVIKKNRWTSGTVYDYYDDNDSNLFDKDFYVVNVDNRVYKCLYNNGGAPSTVEPNDFNPNGDFITLPDGYRWKYMYRYSSADALKFASSSYIPVYTDELVKSYSSNGAIHVIELDNGGTNYPNANGSVVASIDNNTFKVSSVGIENVSNLYKDSTVYIYSGSGTNFISPITAYTVNSVGNFITTSEQTPILDSTSRYKIGPTVRVTGDGSDIGAFAFVDQNTSNSVNRIDVINQGFGYSFAEVEIVANNIALGTGGGATSHAIISPPGGHGYDAVDELGCDTLVISTDIIDPVDILPNWATYRQVSFLNNPISRESGSIFNDAKFTQYVTLSLQYYDNPFQRDAVIVGTQSGARGTVIYTQSSNSYLVNVTGQFQPYETVYDPADPVATNIITEINNSDLMNFTGKILYHKNIEPVVRYSGSREQVKIYFKI